MSTTYVTELESLALSAARQVAALEKIASILERKLANEAELNQVEVDRRFSVWKKETGRKILDYIGTEAPNFDPIHTQIMASRGFGKPPAVQVAQRILDIISESKP